MNEGDMVICLDSPQELGHAVAVASQRAKTSNRLLYVYSHNGFFWLTDCRPDRKDRVAECYPGGRNILYREPA